MANQTRPSENERFPRRFSGTTTEQQDDAIKGFADATGRSVNQVMRDAMAAGLPILIRRAEEDGVLTPAAA